MLAVTQLILELSHLLRTQEWGLEAVDHGRPGLFHRQAMSPWTSHFTSLVSARIIAANRRQPQMGFWGKTFMMWTIYRGMSNRNGKVLSDQRCQEATSARPCPPSLERPRKEQSPEAGEGRARAEEPRDGTSPCQAARESSGSRHPLTSLPSRAPEALL